MGGINLGALMSLEIIKDLEIAPRRVLLIEPPIDAVKSDRWMTFVAGLEKAYEDTDERSLRELYNKPGLGERIDWTAKRLAILRNSPAGIKRNGMVSRPEAYRDSPLLIFLRPISQTIRSFLPPRVLPRSSSSPQTLPSGPPTLSMRRPRTWRKTTLTFDLSSRPTRDTIFYLRRPSLLPRSLSRRTSHK